MQAKWKNFSKEEIAEIVQNSTSFRQVAISLGYSPDGGSSINTVKKVIQDYNLDTSHFLGLGHNKNNFDYDRFIKGKAIKISSALPAIIALRGRKCEKCGLSQWQNNDIPLEIHHEDGDHLNNELSNLILCCPNCHALTENWRGKNINKTEKALVTEEDFVKALQTSPNIRQALLKLGLTAAGGNYSRANELIIKYQIKHLVK